MDPAVTREDGAGERAGARDDLVDARRGDRHDAVVGRRVPGADGVAGSDPQLARGVVVEPPATGDVGADPGSKATKAQDLGVTVLDEAAFKALLDTSG